MGRRPNEQDTPDQQPPAAPSGASATTDAATAAAAPPATVDADTPATVAPAAPVDTVRLELTSALDVPVPGQRGVTERYEAGVQELPAHVAAAARLAGVAKPAPIVEPEA